MFLLSSEVLRRLRKECTDTDKSIGMTCGTLGEEKFGDLLLECTYLFDFTA